MVLSADATLGVRKVRDETNFDRPGPVKKCESSKASTAQTDCWCPLRSYWSVKSFQTLAVLSLHFYLVPVRKAEDRSLIPRTGNDDTGWADMDGTDIICVSD